MKKTILVAALLVWFSLASLAQNSTEKILYVVDSMPVMTDPEPGNDILQGDVADVTVIKSKDTLQRLGYQRFDGVIYLFTKAYRSRPDSLKQIPSANQMTKTNDTWFLHAVPYNGHFIDYYYSGKKKGEGTFKDGKLSGRRVLYYPNGNIEDEWDYTEGIANGWHKEYYEDGSVSQKGMFINEKEEGIWEDYFPNGQVKLRSNYHVGEIFDTATKYYSTGKIKEKVFIKNDKVISDPHLVKISQLLEKSNASNKEGDSKAAIKYCTKALEIDSTCADAYFSRATLKLNDFEFNDAIADFNKALQYEPYMEFALANRAFARIRKYQFASSRTLSKNKDITVTASADKVTIPEDEQDKICSDLHKAIFLGNKSHMITEALSNYCSGNSNE